MLLPVPPEKARFNERNDQCHREKKFDLKSSKKKKKKKNVPKSNIMKELDGSKPMSSLVPRRSNVLELRKNILGLIFKEYNAYILTPKDITLNHLNEEYSILKHYKYSNFENLAHILLLDALTWKYRKKSKSFKFRIKRFTHIDLNFYKNENLIVKSIKTFWRIFLSFKNYLKFFLGTFVVFDLFVFYLRTYN